MMRKVLASTPSVLVLSFLVGYAFHSIQGMSDARTFWVGNLSWPYVLVPALACAGQRGMRPALVRGIGATVSMVLGFYNALGLFSVSALGMGLEPRTPRLTVLATAWGQYLQHLVLGLPGGIPWLTVAVLSGTVLAVVHGFALDHGASLLFWDGVALIGVLEPILHFVPVFAAVPFGGYRFDMAGQAITAAECLLGLALLLAVHHYARATRTASPGERAVC